MFDFIKEHIKFIAITSGIIILILLGVLYVVSSKTSTAPVTEPIVSQDGLIVDSNNQFLLDKNLSNEDKYLTLLAQNMAEDYGTYLLGDEQPLWDLQNHSTPSYGTTVQKIIDTTAKTKNVITKVDSESVKLNRNGNDVTATMDATVTDNTAQTQNQASVTVKLVLEDTYWLVDNITFKNK